MLSAAALGPRRACHTLLSGLPAASAAPGRTAGRPAAPPARQCAHRRRAATPLLGALPRAAQRLQRCRPAQLLPLQRRPRGAGAAPPAPQLLSLCSRSAVNSLVECSRLSTLTDEALPDWRRAASTAASRTTALMPSLMTSESACKVCERLTLQYGQYALSKTHCSTFRSAVTRHFQTRRRWWRAGIVEKAQDKQTLTETSWQAKLLGHPYMSGYTVYQPIF